MSVWGNFRVAECEIVSAKTFENGLRPKFGGLKTSFARSNQHFTSFNNFLGVFS